MINLFPTILNETIFLRNVEAAEFLKTLLDKMDQTYDDDISRRFRGYFRE